MAIMSRIDLSLKYIKEYATYIILTFIVIVIGILMQAQTLQSKNKYKNEIYELKAEVDSLKETINLYERSVVNE